MLKVKIVEYVDDWQPGWVKCTFKDVYEKDWLIIEKVPVVSEEYLLKDSSYPTTGVVGCEIISRTFNPENKIILTINIEKPWGITEVNGNSIFEVFDEQVIEG